MMHVLKELHLNHGNLLIHLEDQVAVSPVYRATFRHSQINFIANSKISSKKGSRIT